MVKSLMTCAYIVYRVLGSRHCTRELGNSPARVMMVRLVKIKPRRDAVVASGGAARDAARGFRRDRRPPRGRHPRGPIADPWERQRRRLRDRRVVPLLSSSSSPPAMMATTKTAAPRRERPTTRPRLPPSALPPGTGAYAPPGRVREEQKTQMRTLSRRRSKKPSTQSLARTSRTTGPKPTGRTRAATASATDPLRCS